MKQTSHLAAGAALVLATLGSPSAMAGPTCDLCSWVGGGSPANTYVGSFNSATHIEDAVEFRRAGTAFTTLTTFTDVWLFELNPSPGSFSINSQFNFAPGGITGFQVQLRNVTSTSGCGLVTDAAASFCSGGYTLGSVIATSAPPNAGGQVFLNDMQLLAAPAYYAWVVSGTRTTATVYNGTATIQAVPEPTSLALVGAGLLAAAIGARRKRAA